MKLVFKVTLFASFLLIVVFGFTAMNHGMHCIASTMQGADCPVSLFGFASFHISFFKNFSSAVFENLGLLAFFFALIIFFAVLISLRGKPVSANSSFFKLTNEAGGQSSLIKKIRSWLSLLENSPSFAFAR